MPQGDGTGPRGQGPLTGRGLGNCSGSRPAAGYYLRGFGRGTGWGRGFGRRGGWGRGVGAGYGWGYTAAPRLTSADETAMLKDEAAALEEELKSVRARLSDIEPGDKK